MFAAKMPQQASNDLLDKFGFVYESAGEYLIYNQALAVLAVRCFLAFERLHLLFTHCASASTRHFPRQEQYEIT